MAKNQGIDPKASTAARIRRTEAYAEKVRLLFAQTVNEILALNKTMPKLDDGVMFSFDGESMKKQKEVEALLRRLHSAVTMAIREGVSLEWAEANAEADKLVKSVFGQAVLDSPEFTAWTQRNTAARDAFLARSEKGLNLSDRVWKSVRQLRDELEVAVTVSMGEGKSASAMSREVRQYLNDPDLMFRRFRYKKGEDKDGNPVYGRKWKKRVKDEATGKYKWIDYDRDSYKTGAGVYKSSAKNAMRLTRTETNIAYRRADHERWQQMDFVLGQRVQLSKNHPKPDICDKLQGDYPKEFVFDGWHPQCFCFVTPILVDAEEMAKVNEAFLKGEKYIPKGQRVTEYPDNFKDWVKEHAADIADARDRGTEPYFIRNNAAVIDEILNPKPKELTIAEKAALRHAARTPEQEDAIRRAWAERNHQREVIKKGAGNVLKVAQDWPEVDYADLQAAIDSGDYMRMKAASKAVAQSIVAMRNEEKALSSLIPDVHTWHKQFTMAELQGVYTAIDSKLSVLSSLSLAEQKKKLEFEILYVADPSKYKAGAVKHSTWKVAQDAYTSQLSKVQYKIDMDAAKQQLAIVKSWSVQHPKSLKVAGLVADAELAIANGEDLAVVQQKTALANAEYQKRLAEQARRNAKRVSQSSFDFDSDCFTDARRNAAPYAIDAQDADDYFHDNAVEFWKKLTDEEKQALWGYTGGSAYITEPLRAIKGHYYAYSSRLPESEKHIKDMSTALSKQTLNSDVWIKRDSDPWNINYIFGIDLDTFQSNPSALIGKIGLEDSFQSCGSCKNTRFTCTGPKTVVMRLYCPKGTYGAYAQPWSSCGTFGRSWDGVSKSNPTNRCENEVILQRGAKLRITKAEYKGGMWYIDVDVLGFNIRDFDMVDSGSGYYCDFH